MLNKKNLLEKAKKALAITLAGLMVTGFAPGLGGGALTVHAQTDKYSNSWIGTYGLNDTYGLMYFGTYNGNPVKYRIYSMNPKEVYTGLWTFETREDKDIILLDCDTTLENMQYHSSVNANFYTSTLCDWLNGTYLDTLSEVEQNSIVEVKHSPYAPAGSQVTEEGFTYKKIFILSSEEATTGRYVGTKRNKNGKKWWVRTHNYNDGNPKKGYISGTNINYTEATNANIGVSPAFCLNKDSILFSCGTPELDVRKVTLADNNLVLTVDAGDVYMSNDNKVVVPYSLSGSDASKVTSVAAYFRLNDESDTNYKKMYGYSKLSMSEKPSSSGVGTITLPDDLKTKRFGTDYSMFVIAEINNEGYLPDYASNYEKINHIHDYTLSITGEKAIIQCSCGASYTAAISAEDAEYDGIAVEAKIKKSAGFTSTVNVGEITYTGIEETSYNSANAPTDAGMYTASAPVTFEGTTKNISTSFEITPKNLLSGMLSVTPSSFEYDGKTKSPAIVVKDAGKTLVKDTDYTIDSNSVTSADAISAGDGYTITVKGKGNYKGSASSYWNIEKGKEDKKEDSKPDDGKTDDGMKDDNGNNDNGGNNNSGNNNNNSGNNNSGNNNNDNGGNNNSGSNDNNSGNNNSGNNNNNGENNDSGNGAGNNGSTNTPAAKGLTISNDTASYVVTSSNAKNPTVQYKASKKKTENIIIPDTVKLNGVKYKITEVGAKAFYKNTKAKKVKIGKYVTKIGKQAFYGCSNVETVTGGASVKTIGAAAYSGCVKLKKAPIGAKVTSIGDKAFYNCQNMTTMVIPVNVNKLGKQFAGKTPKLKTVTVKTKKLTKKNVKAKACTGMGSNKTTVKTPKGMSKTYKALLQSKGLNKKIKVK